MSRSPEFAIRYLVDETWARAPAPHGINRQNLDGQECPAWLPAPGLQHVGFVQACHREAFHRSLQIFADFK